MTEVTHFYLLAAAIGLVQGGIQSLSRSYYASLVPEGKQGEFFGFYNMMGKFAAVLGPMHGRDHRAPDRRHAHRDALDPRAVRRRGGPARARGAIAEMSWTTRRLGAVKG